MKKSIIYPVESHIPPKKNIQIMLHIMNIMREDIKKNIRMIIEIIIVIKIEKDILLIILNMRDMKNMNQNMKEEVEVDIVLKDIIVAVKENIVEIAIVGVGVEEVEIIMNQNQIIIIIIIYIIKIIAEIKRLIIIKQRKEIIKKKEDV
jgi:hypothetical protein